MTDQKKVEREGSGAAETSHIAADSDSARRRRLTAARKQEAVLRVCGAKMWNWSRDHLRRQPRLSPICQPQGTEEV